MYHIDVSTPLLIVCIPAINYCSFWPHCSFRVMARNSFTVSFTTSPSCLLFLILPVHFWEHSGSQSIVCLFLFIAFREEELQGKVSWQLIPGQRSETASCSLIRNHLCTLTSPLNLGFTDTLSSFSSSLSPHLPPPVSSVFVFFLCFFWCFLPLSTSADDQEVSAAHCLSLVPPPHSLAHDFNTESIVNCWELQCIFHTRGNAFWLFINKRLCFFLPQRATQCQQRHRAQNADASEFVSAWKRLTF